MTTRRQYLVNIPGLFLLSATLLGQNFWDGKDYRQWTSDEVSMLTSNSPWSKKLNDLTITWLTALPVKQALLKERLEAGGILADSAEQIMGTEEEYYAIGITGLPADRSDDLTEVSLKVENKAVIKPTNGSFQPRGRTVDVMVIFPRTAPIIIDDGQVEVILKLGSEEMGTKFLLKDMVYKGKLEL